MSYGSMARFRKVERLFKVTDKCVMGVGGEYSDCQEIIKMLKRKTNREYCVDDGHTLSTKEIHQYLARLMFQKRSKMDPLWNSVILGGVEKDGKNILAFVDLYGTNFESEVLATGYAIYMGLPLLRKAYREDITCDEAKKVLEDVMRVLYYRDARTGNRIQIAKVTAEGAEVSEPIVLETEWSYEAFKSGARGGDISTW